MNPDLLKLSILIAAIIGPVSVWADPQDGEHHPEIIGDAYDLKSGEWRYREVHWPEYQSENGDWIRRIEYQTADGRVFADKVLNLGDGSREPRLRPQVTQINRDTGRVLSVVSQTEDSGATANIKLQPDTSTPALTGQLPISEKGVIDAGFDSWIQHNWTEIASGGPVRFDFLAASRLRWVALIARRQECESKDPSSLNAQWSASPVCVEVVPKNRLLRWLVPAIDLVYQAGESGQVRLVKFSGLGNLVDTSGQGLRVDIFYRYHFDPVLMMSSEP